MKRVFLLSKAVLAAGVVVMSLGSCKNEAKQEDPKEVAEDQTKSNLKIVKQKKTILNF